LHPNPLTLGPDGNFYGTTQHGGAYGGGDYFNYGLGYGTLFRLKTDGSLSVLINFNFTNGANPSTELTLGNDGALYGTTERGGTGSYGTLFRVTTDGNLTTIASFDIRNGAYPSAALTVAPDNYFYGSTAGGGTTNYFAPEGMGTMFKVSPTGTLTTLALFSVV